VGASSWPALAIKVHTAPITFTAPLPSKNVKDTPYEVRSATNKAGWARGRARNSPLFNKGAGHPVSIPIETPAGRFANATEAAEHFGITRQGVRYRIKAGWDGWRYVAETVFLE
jgi:hypothetical protein